jgi:hypothetical protein
MCSWVYIPELIASMTKLTHMLYNTNGKAVTRIIKRKVIFHIMVTILYEIKYIDIILAKIVLKNQNIGKMM